VPRFSGRYVEPFLGGGAVFFHMEPRESIINDINGKLMSFYRGVRDDFVRLRAELMNGNYSEVFDRCEAGDFMFLGPPYDCVFSDYGNEEYKAGFDDDSHRRLAADFANLPCMALMVIGKTPLTEDLYAGHIVEEYEKNHSVNIRNRFKVGARHIVVTNYDKRWESPVIMPEDYAYEPETAQVMLFERGAEYGKGEENR